MSGPQEERLSKWSKDADLGYPETREAISGPHVAGKERRHQDQINQLRALVEHLKQLRNLLKLKKINLIIRFLLSQMN